jgi:hypothetical protein
LAQGLAPIVHGWLPPAESSPKSEGQHVDSSIVTADASFELRSARSGSEVFGRDRAE